MKMNRMRMALLFACAFHFAAYILTKIIIHTGKGYEMNPVTAFALSNFGGFEILFNVGVYGFIIGMYEWVYSRNYKIKTLTYGSIAVMLISYFDFVNDLIVLLA